MGAGFEIRGKRNLKNNYFNHCRLLSQLLETLPRLLLLLSLAIAPSSSLLLIFLLLLLFFSYPFLSLSLFLSQLCSFIQEKDEEEVEGEKEEENVSP